LKAAITPKSKSSPSGHRPEASGTMAETSSNPATGSVRSRTPARITEAMRLVAAAKGQAGPGTGAAAPGLSPTRLARNVGKSPVAASLRDCQQQRHAAGYRANPSATSPGGGECRSSLCGGAITPTSSQRTNPAFRRAQESGLHRVGTGPDRPQGHRLISRIRSYPILSTFTGLEGQTQTGRPARFRRCNEILTKTRIFLSGSHRQS